MFMRYEWGLGIGHTYSHSNATIANQKVLADWRLVQNDQNMNPPNPLPNPPPDLAMGGHAGPQPTTIINEAHNNAAEPVENTLPTVLDIAGEGDEESDAVSTNADDDDYFSNPECDSEDEREAMLFGWGPD